MPDPEIIFLIYVFWSWIMSSECKWLFDPIYCDQVIAFLALCNIFELFFLFKPSANLQWLKTTACYFCCCYLVLFDIRRPCFMTLVWCSQAQNRIVAMTSSRSDWCISRQRTWGVPIPVFYHVDSQEPLITEETIEHVKGISVYFLHFFAIFLLWLEHHHCQSSYTPRSPVCWCLGRVPSFRQ